MGALTLADLGGWPAVLGPLTSGRSLTSDQAEAAMADILEGVATPAQLAGFIVACAKVRTSRFGRLSTGCRYARAADRRRPLWMLRSKGAKPSCR